jgi:hypothetical protein
MTAELLHHFEDTDPQYAEWMMELDYAFRNWSSLP